MNSTKKLLSFADDEEDDNDVFVLKKSNQSRRMDRQKNKKKKETANPFPDDHSSKAPTKEVYNLQTPSQERNKDYDSVNEIIIPDSDEEEDNDGPKFVFRNRAMDDVQSALSKGLIPDKDSIARLKEQRQKRAQIEYIDLADDDDNNEAIQREMESIPKFDLSDGSDIEDDAGTFGSTRRIHLGKVDYSDSDRQKNREIIRDSQRGPRKFKDEDSEDSEGSEEDEEEDNDEENETDRWEREQMQKAMKLKTIKGIEKNHKSLSKMFSKTPPKSSLGVSRPSQVSQPPKPEFEKHQKVSSSHTLPSHITNDSRELTFQDLNNRRVPMRNQMMNDIEDQKRMLERTKMDLELTEKALKHFEERKETLVEEYNLFRGTKEFVGNLSNCINDKYSIVRRIDDQIYDLYEDVSRKQKESQKLLINDYDYCTKNLFTNRESFRERFRDLDGKSIFDFYDFEGDSEMKNRIWLQEQIGNKEELSLDQKTRETLKEFKKESFELFKDTDKEYSEIYEILAKFKAWRTGQESSYLESFAGEFIAKFLVFYFGVSNLFQNILVDEEDGEEFPVELWRLPGMMEVQEFVDPDLDSVILPTLVDSVILTKLKRYLDLWNPFSVVQSLRISKLLKSLVKNIPSLVDSSKVLPEILQAVLLKFEATLDHEIPMLMIEQTGEPGVGASAYELAVYNFNSGHLRRHIKRILGIWKNMLSFSGLIDDDILEEIVRDKLARKHAFICLSNKNIHDGRLVEYLDDLFGDVPESWISSGSAIKWFKPWIGVMLKNRCSEGSKLEECLKNYENMLTPYL